MASAFGHAAFGAALGTWFPSPLQKAKFFLLGMFCTILPDFDVIGFKFGIAYESFWGHRGFTHSFLFALMSALLITLISYQKGFSLREKTILVLYFFICTSSHSILDAMTSGGHGVALFSPWDDKRIFFDFRPIKVSPIGVKNFFSKWGLEVIKSEAIWIGIPSFLILITGIAFRRKSGKKI